MENIIRDLITTSQELNGTTITELTSEPSPLEFLRLVGKNRPLVIRGGASHWPAHRSWTAAYLRSVMEDTSVNVASTPKGNADAVVEHAVNGRRYFTKPMEEDMPFADFLHHVQRQELDAGLAGDEVKYAQTQNDNLRGEYRALFADVAQDIPWARIALQRGPEAINLWIGNSRSVTALHRDNYENIYCQVVGAKHFVLIPPSETACINEQVLPPATYQRPKGRQLEMIPDVAGVDVPCAIWDPESPEHHANAFAGFCKPLRVDLFPGDMLYLPALWYHKVSQSCGPEGFCCAVNYWYDMDFDGALFSSAAFVRSTALLFGSKSAAGVVNN